MPAPGEWHLGDPLELTDEDKRSHAQRMARIAGEADPRLLARFRRWEQHGLTPRNIIEGLPQAIRPQATHFDSLARWYAGYLGVRDEFTAPFELRQDLKQQVPQAILRDIYRPVRAAQFELSRHELDLDPGGTRAFSEVRAALRREPLPTIEPSLIDVVTEQRRRRRFVDTPWPPFRPDEAPRYHTPQDGFMFSGVDRGAADADAAAEEDPSGESADAFARFASVADGPSTD